MKIVFMGTPEFAVASLDILVKNNYTIVAVVTAPDKPAGRGQTIQQSAVKKYAVEKGLKVLQPEKLKDETFIAELKSLHADLQIVVAFRMLPEVVWNMPKAGTFNLHASLLPRYRGAAPINWAIINGDTESGVTTFKLKHEIDTGSVLYTHKVSIGKEETAGELHDKLMQVGSELVLKTAQANEAMLNTGVPLTFTEQDERGATHAPKLFRETCKINWNDAGEKIHNLVRGLSPYPAAWCKINNGGEESSLKIFKVRFEKKQHGKTNGLLIAENGTLNAYCRDGIITINELQAEGKKRMVSAEFMRGYKLKEGAFLL